MKKIDVCLHKKGAHTLERDELGKWFIDKKELSQERAILELAEAVQDLGYWCQVAKDVLDEDVFDTTNEVVAYEEPDQ